MSERLQFKPPARGDDIRRLSLARYRDVIAQAQQTNKEYPETLFGIIWQGNPWVDCILVNTHGEIVGHWETLRSLIPMPPLSAILASGQERRQLLYPFGPGSQCDTRIFFTTSLKHLLRQHLGELETVTIGQTDQERIFVAFIPAGGLAKLRTLTDQNRVVLGKLALWRITKKPKRDVSTLASEIPAGMIRKDLAPGYYPRVFVRGFHPAIGKKTVITPLKASDVLLAGRTPLDLQDDICRIETPSEMDFIPGAFAAYSQDFRLKGTSLIIYYPIPYPR